MTALLAALALAAAPAFDPGEPLSLEGFSGHLDVPSAYTHAAGSLHLLFTNQKDPRSRGRAFSRTWIASGGFLRWLEGAGRVTDAGGSGTGLGMRDLSFNAKLRLPLDLRWPELPLALAVGTQDDGGAAPHFRTRYAVASARAGWLTASAGYGTGPDRMDGAFAGATLSPTRYTDLVADWDARELNAGVRLRLPFSALGVPLEAAAIAKTSVQGRRLELAAALALPLALSEWRDVPLAAREQGRRPAEAREEPLAPSVAPPQAAPEGPSADGDLSPIESALDDLGLSGVRAARDGDTCAVEYENERYGHAEADALGLVLGTLATLAPGDCARFLVLLDRQQLPLAALEGPMASLRAYFTPGGAEDLPATLRLRFGPRRPAALAARAPRNPGALHGQLSLAPGLTSFLATEVSVLDVLVSLRPEATLQLWPGAQLAVAADVPLYRSRELGAGGTFQEYDHGPRLTDALLQQALPLLPGLTALVAAGVHRTHAAGVLGELLLTPGGGAHAFGLQAAALRLVDALPAPSRVDPAPDGPSAVGTWRWAAPWSLVARVRAGRFHSGDRGGSIDVGRFFGDTLVGVFYARTDTAIFGASLSLPLGPHRDTRPGPAQLRGTRRFAHEVYTVVGETRNDITPGVGLVPQSPWNLEATWLDHSRVNRDSLAAALARARRAFMRWGRPAVARSGINRV